MTWCKLLICEQISNVIYITFIKLIVWITYTTEMCNFIYILNHSEVICLLKFTCLDILLNEQIYIKITQKL